MTPSHWSVTQAIVWIATRNLPTTEAVGSDDLIASSEIQSDRTHVALEELVTKCGRGEIAIYGRRYGVGNAERIEPHTWALVEIRDDQARNRVIATYPTRPSSPTRFSPTWWSDLRLSVSDIQRIWPLFLQNKGIPSEIAETRQAKVGGAQAIDDSQVLQEIHRAISAGTSTSVRDEVLARAADIKGASDDAKVRRLQRKYSDRFNRSNT